MTTTVADNVTATLDSIARLRDETNLQNLRATLDTLALLRDDASANLHDALTSLRSSLTTELTSRHTSDLPQEPHRGNVESLIPLLSQIIDVATNAYHQAQRLDHTIADRRWLQQDIRDWSTLPPDTQSNIIQFWEKRADEWQHMD